MASAVALSFHGTGFCSALRAALPQARGTGRSEVKNLFIIVNFIPRTKARNLFDLLKLLSQERMVHLHVLMYSGLFASKHRPQQKVMDEIGNRLKSRAGTQLSAASVDGKIKASTPFNVYVAAQPASFWGTIVTSDPPYEGCIKLELLQLLATPSSLEITPVLARFLTDEFYDDFLKLVRLVLR